MALLPDFQRIIGRLRVRHLALLDALGQDPNLGRAAQRLHMAQPTASKLLREIEALFEEQLFIRNRRGLTPTASGQALTRRASFFLTELSAAHAELGATRQGASGRLRLGVFPVVIPEFFPAFFKNLRQRWPNLHYSLVEAIETPLIAQLSAGEIDCIIGRIVLDSLTPDLRHEVLYDEATVIVCGVNHPLITAAGEDAFRAALNASKWILPAPKGAIYSLVASWLASRGGSAPIVEIENTSVFVITEMLNHAPLLAVLPENVAIPSAAQQKTAFVPGGNLTSPFPIGIIYRADSAHNPLIQAVIASAHGAAKEGLGR